MSVAALSDLPPPRIAGNRFRRPFECRQVKCNQRPYRQKRLAFASKTPGRTQLLNFFELSERDQEKQIVVRGMLVDLPGYGFAQAPQAQTQPVG